MVNGRLIVEYSASAKAACPLCGSSIAKDIVRIGRETTTSGFLRIRWHHPECFGRHYPDADFSQMTGFLSLKVTDQTALRAMGLNAKETKSKGTTVADEVPSKAVVAVKSLSTALGFPNFHPSKLSKSYKDIPLPAGWKAFSTLILYEADNLKPSEKIAAFDFDGTLVDTSVYRPGPDAWSLLYPSIPAKLASLHKQGYKLVVFTNESNIDRFTKQRARAIDSKLGRLKGFMQAVRLPLQVFVACGTSKSNDIFRKPATGMWQLLENNLNAGVPVDRKRSFFVGDAAGRKTDHSDADIKFAQALGLSFTYPEEMFLPESQTSPGQGHGSDKVVLREQDIEVPKDIPKELLSEEHPTAREEAPLCMETSITRAVQSLGSDLTVLRQGNGEAQTAEESATHYIGTSNNSGVQTLGSDAKALRQVGAEARPDISNWLLRKEDQTAEKRTVQTLHTSSPGTP